MSRFNKALETHGPNVIRSFLRDGTTPYALAIAEAGAEEKQKEIYSTAAVLVEEIKASQELLARLTEANISRDDKDKYIKPLFTAFAHMTDASAARRSGPWKYLDWICRTYNKNNTYSAAIRSEDLYKVKRDIMDLESFSQHMEPEERSIDKYESYQDLLETLHPYQIRRDQKKAEKKQRKIDPEKLERIMQETTIIYDGPEGKIVVPHNAEASIYWGQQTRWCTAAEKSMNYFDNYNKDEPLWLYMPRPNNKEISIYKNYHSFKYTGTQGRLYDERDDHPSHLPPYLERLIDAALKSLPYRRKRFLQKYGSYRKYHPVVPSDPAKWNDSKAMLATIKKSTFAAKFVHQDLLQDKNFRLEMYKRDLAGIEDVPETFWADRDFVKKAVAINPSVFTHADEKLKDDAGIANRIFSQKKWRGYGIYEQLSPRLRDNSRLAFKAVRRDSNAFEHASERLRSKFMLVAAAVRHNGFSLAHASPALRDNKWIVAMATRNQGDAFRYASDRLQNNRRWFRWAMKKGYSPETLPEKYQNDRGIVKLWVSRNGGRLLNIPDRFKRDKGIIRAALKSFPDVLNEMDNIKNDRRVIMDAVTKCGVSLARLGEELRNDPEIVRAAVSVNGMALDKAPEKFRADRKVVKAAVQNNGEALQFATPDLRSDWRIVVNAVSGSGNPKKVLTHASLELRLDKSVRVCAGLKTTWRAVSYPARKLGSMAYKSARNLTEKNNYPEPPAL